MRRLLVLLFLLPLQAYAQGAGTPPYRGVNNWPLIFGTDNTYDIGAAGAQRPRTGYFGTSVVTPALTVSGLTSGRVPVASTGGALTDFSTLAFSGGTLTATNLTATSGVTAASVTDSGLTSGRVPLAGIGGLLGDDADLTFATDRLTADKLTVTTGPLFVPSGTAAAPGIGRTADTDDGIFLGEISYFTRDGIETVGFSRSGAVATVRVCDASVAGCGTFMALEANQTNGMTFKTNGGTIREFIGGGAAVASATALPLPTGRTFHVTGTTTITSVTSTGIGSGTCVTLIFDGVLTFTDGSNLVLAGNFVTTADDTITICYDGTNWYETGRSIN